MKKMYKVLKKTLCILLSVTFIVTTLPATIASANYPTSTPLLETTFQYVELKSGDITKVEQIFKSDSIKKIYILMMQ